MKKQKPKGEKTEQEKIAEAITDGFLDVDEACSKCATVFKNYHHFVRCDENVCPMRSSTNTKSVAEMILGI